SEQDGLDVLLDVVTVSGRGGAGGIDQRRPVRAEIYVIVLGEPRPVLRKPVFETAAGSPSRTGGCRFARTNIRELARAGFSELVAHPGRTALGVDQSGGREGIADAAGQRGEPGRPGVIDKRGTGRVGMVS